MDYFLYFWFCCWFRGQCKLSKLSSLSSKFFQCKLIMSISLDSAALELQLLADTYCLKMGQYVTGVGAGFQAIGDIQTLHGGHPMEQFYNNIFYAFYKWMLNTSMDSILRDCSDDLSHDIRNIILKYADEFDTETTDISFPVFWACLESFGGKSEMISVALSLQFDCEPSDDDTLDLHGFILAIRFFAAVQNGHVFEDPDNALRELLLQPMILYPVLDYPRNITLPTVTYTCFDTKFKDCVWFMSFGQLMEYEKCIEAFQSPKQIGSPGMLLIMAAQSKLDYETLSHLLVQCSLWTVQSCVDADCDSIDACFHDKQENDIRNLIQIAMIHIMFTMEKRKDLDLPEKLPDCLCLENIVRIGAKHIYIQYDGEHFDYEFGQKLIRLLHALDRDEDKPLNPVMKRFAAAEESLAPLEEIKKHCMALKFQMLVVERDDAGSDRVQELMEQDIGKLFVETLQESKEIGMAIQDIQHRQEEKGGVHEKIFRLEQSKIQLLLDKLELLDTLQYCPSWARSDLVGTGMSKAMMVEFRSYLEELKREQKSLFELTNDNSDHCVKLFEMKRIEIDLRIQYLELVQSMTEKGDEIMGNETEMKEKELKVNKWSNTINTLITKNLNLRSENTQITQMKKMIEKNEPKWKRQNKKYESLKKQHNELLKYQARYQVVVLFMIVFGIYRFLAYILYQNDDCTSTILSETEQLIGTCMSSGSSHTTVQLQSIECGAPRMVINCAFMVVAITVLFMK
eukprot:231155_1